MQKPDNKKSYLKFILIFALTCCLLNGSDVLRCDAFAGDNGTGWFNGDTAGSSSFAGYEGYTRIISTLLVVVALIIGTAYVLKKKFGVSAGIGMSKKFIQIVDHIPMGVKKSLFFVKVPGKHLLLGVTNDRIEMITEIANEDITDESAPVNKTEFLSLIKKSISERKQR